MNNLRALYATCDTPTGKRTYRVGLPASDAVITRRHARFDNAHYRNRRRLTINLRSGASYPVLWLEIRDVDAQGRGLGSERHSNAYGVQVSSLRIEPDAPHAVEVLRLGKGALAIIANHEGDITALTGLNVPTAVRSARKLARSYGRI